MHEPVNPAVDLLSQLQKSKEQVKDLLQRVKDRQTLPIQVEMQKLIRLIDTTKTNLPDKEVALQFLLKDFVQETAKVHFEEFYKSTGFSLIDAAAKKLGINADERAIRKALMEGIFAIDGDVWVIKTRNDTSGKQYTLPELLERLKKLAIALKAQKNPELIETLLANDTSLSEKDKKKPKPEHVAKVLLENQESPAFKEALKKQVEDHSDLAATIEFLVLEVATKSTAYSQVLLDEAYKSLRDIKLKANEASSLCQKAVSTLQTGVIAKLEANSDEIAKAASLLKELQEELQKKIKEEISSSNVVTPEERMTLVQEARRNEEILKDSQNRALKALENVKDYLIKRLEEYANKIQEFQNKAAQGEEKINAEMQLVEKRKSVGALSLSMLFADLEKLEKEQAEIQTLFDEVSSVLGTELQSSYKNALAGMRTTVAKLVSSHVALEKELIVARATKELAVKAATAAAFKTFEAKTKEAVKEEMGELGKSGIVTKARDKILEETRKAAEEAAQKEAKEAEKAAKAIAEAEAQRLAEETLAVVRAKAKAIEDSLAKIASNNTAALAASKLVGDQLSKIGDLVKNISGIATHTLVSGYSLETAKNLAVIKYHVLPQLKQRIVASAGVESYDDLSQKQKGKYDPKDKVGRLEKAINNGDLSAAIAILKERRTLAFLKFLGTESNKAYERSSVGKNGKIVDATELNRIEANLQLAKAAKENELKVAELCGVITTVFPTSKSDISEVSTDKPLNLADITKSVIAGNTENKASKSLESISRLAESVDKQITALNSKAQVMLARYDSIVELGDRLVRCQQYSPFAYGLSSDSLPIFVERAKKELAEYKVSSEAYRKALIEHGKTLNSIKTAFEDLKSLSLLSGEALAAVDTVLTNLASAISNNEKKIAQLEEKIDKVSRVVNGVGRGFVDIMGGLDDGSQPQQPDVRQQDNYKPYKGEIDFSARSSNEPGEPSGAPVLKPGLDPSNPFAS